ncbi:MAG: S46 family peptidase [Pirellula sp.]|nr:S46 family peptidase [Pirellula sp.]
MMNRYLRWIPASLCIAICSHAFSDEGMYPVSELPRLKLETKGLKIGSEELFNADKVSVVDGICKVNGCTGSFVSADGLIITNHHCAFDAIQKGSSSSNDILQDGFIAKTRADEIRAVGYTVRITESYSDVSKEVLQVASDTMPFLDRTKAIDKRRKELEKEAEQKNAGLRAEVAEMFPGKTYVLFLYTYLKDVRLVFAPPISIGAFGGETDNWEWPRHTGDFSFMRAYTAPNGSAAEYSPENVPFKPKRPIRVNAQGVNEEDFVFILGYPGRTVRQKTASFFRYEQNIRLPIVAELYAWQIAEMEKAGAVDRGVAIKHSSRSKSLANVEKRSRGQVLGLKRTDLVSKRVDEETKLKEFVNAKPEFKAKYSNLFREIDSVYEEMSANGPVELHFKELRSACRTLSFAFTLLDAAVERQKEDLDREAPYMERNFSLTMQQLKLDVGDLDRNTDVVMMNGMLERLQKLNANKAIPELNVIVGGSPEDSKSVKTALQQAIMNTRLGDVAFIEECSKKTPAELERVQDGVLQVMIRLYPAYRKLRDLDKERDGKLNQLYGSLVEVKQAYEPTTFVPDANATLRITYGRVRGYSPADAVQRTPISTLDGVLEKTTGSEPYISPKKLLATVAAKDFGPFVHPKLGKVPVAILYDTDTTGGNSGSPVLNANAELVAVNFDRTFEATINDFAWNSSYSRSIGVDIRYVLWVTGRVYGANHLLEEMGVSSR